MPKIIFESEIEDLLSVLAHGRQVIAPVFERKSSAEEKYTFRKWEKGRVPALDYPTTILPPKEFLLPPHETLFNFRGQDTSPPEFQKTVLFGLNISDLEGIFLLSQVFARPAHDEVYTLRRKDFLIVGVDRFSPPKNIPFDLYLMKLPGKRYAGFAGSKEGQNILRNKFFKSQSIRVPSVKKGVDPLLSDKELSRAIEKSKNHKVWDELAEICFGCGICSYVCPLCYCFEAHDEIDFSGDGKSSGRRCRTWDSCLLEHFAETSHHNFRPELRDRIYSWYFHKFVRMPGEYGFVGCVDCNRCIVFCPAKINYRKVLEEVLADYKKLNRRKK